ncbi:MAG TPA: hypothetical protein VGY31_05235 [Terriglobia bacterium]|nr:hypothetical protein [Terriglobia bacterium]
MSRRTLSNIEHLAEANIACSVRLAGRLNLGELRTALAGVQRRHPALRALIRLENNVLYYEPDGAPEIPLRAVQGCDDGAYRSERDFELSTPFDHELPQLRVVYFEGEGDCDLLFTTSHRICDALSVFILAKDVLRFLARRTEVSPHDAIGVREIIGAYRPARPRITSIGVSLANMCLRFLPASGPAPKRKQYFVEWSAGREASAALRRQCRAEGVSVHAAFLVALDRALWSVLRTRSPKWITCPIDLRRGRFPALTEDMLFYGGGNFKIPTGRWIKGDFWDNARVLTREVRARVERELIDLPGRLFFFERLRPLTCGQARWLERASEALQSKRRVRGIGVANLGNIQFSASDCPLPLKDVRFSFRSLSFGILGMFPHTVNQEMRFYCTSSETFTNECELRLLKREFMRALEQQIERKWAEAVTV